MRNRPSTAPLAPYAVPYTHLHVARIFANAYTNVCAQVNYVTFLRESNPPPAVLAALGQIHSFLAEAAQQDGLSATEALGAVLGIEGTWQCALNALLVRNWWDIQGTSGPSF